MDGFTESILAEATPEQMLELHNQLPGVRQVARMGDRSTAVARLRLALERTEMKLSRISQRPGEYRVVPATAVNAIKGATALERKIRVLIDHNPKIGESMDRFEIYRDGMTISEYVETVLERWPNISRARALRDTYWDRQRGFIAVDE